MNNNCGFNGVSRFFKPPYRVMFNADCSIHDQNYETGGTKEDKLTADLGFLWRMLQDCNQEQNYNKKRRAVKIAITYYILVRLFGFISYRFK